MWLTVKATRGGKRIQGGNHAHVDRPRTGKRPEKDRPIIDTIGDFDGPRPDKEDTAVWAKKGVFQCKQDGQLLFLSGERIPT